MSNSVSYAQLSPLGSDHLLEDVIQHGHYTTYYGRCHERLGVLTGLVFQSLHRESGEEVAVFSQIGSLRELLLILRGEGRGGGEGVEEGGGGEGGGGEKEEGWRRDGGGMEEGGVEGGVEGEG